MLTLLLLACPAPAVPGGLPHVGIAWPMPVEETDVVCPVFTVVLDLQNFTMNPDHYGGENVEGEGHWHMWLDNPNMDSAPAGAPKVPFGSPNKDVDGDGLPEGIETGTHSITVQLVQNDHTSLPEDQQGEHIAQVEFVIADELGCQGSFGLDDDVVDTGGDSGS